MWILWNILAGLSIAIVLTISKKYGTTPLQSYLLYMFGTAVSVGWILPYAYKISPNFTYPYFIQAAALSVFGVILGKFVFNDIISLNGWLGILQILIGICLIAKG